MPPLDFVGDYFWFAVLMCVLLLVGTGYAIAQNSISAISNDINAVIGNKGKSFDRARFFQSFQQLNLEHHRAGHPPRPARREPTR